MVDYDLAGVLAGMFFLVLGVVLLFVSFIVWPVIFYAIGCIGIGLAILITLKKQDEVEQINWKDIKRKKDRN